MDKYSPNYTHLFGDLVVDGVECYVRNGHVYIVDEADKTSYPDTNKNRALVVGMAKRVIKAWKEGR